MEFNKEIVNSLMDLTSLNDNDNEDSIINLCKKAHNNLGNVASVCIYKQFIHIAKPYLKNFNIFK